MCWAGCGYHPSAAEQPKRGAVLKKVIAALAGLAAFAPAALASSHFVKVSPGTVSPGQTVTVSGSVDHGCQIGHKGDAATILSSVQY